MLVVFVVVIVSACVGAMATRRAVRCDFRSEPSLHLFHYQYSLVYYVETTILVQAFRAVEKERRSINQILLKECALLIACDQRSSDESLVGYCDYVVDDATLL